MINSDKNSFIDHLENIFHVNNITYIMSKQAPLTPSQIEYLKISPKISASHEAKEQIAEIMRNKYANE